MRSKRRWYPILIIGVVLLLASSIVGCPQPPVSTPPVIAEFSANPTNINSGESATLSWSVTEATTVTIDQGIGDVPNSGMQSVSPTTTTTYTLTAINSAGIVTESVAITVTDTPKPPSDCTCFSYTLKRYIPCEQATAICRDGTCSISKSRSGTCSHHGGVARWIN